MPANRTRRWCALGAVALLLAPTRADVPTGFDALQQARGLFLEGHYDAAVDACRRAADSPATRAAAQVLWADIDGQRGRYREAIDRLRTADPPAEESPDWAAALAAHLAEVGEYDEAVRLCRQALERFADHARARELLGRVYETLGRRREAMEVYRPFDELLRERLPDDAPDLTWVGRGFYRYSVLSRHENLKERCKYVLQEVYQEAFDFVDARYWPARLAAAELLLEKHALDEAAEDFRRVLRTNSRAAAAHVGLACVALERWDFEQAERRCRRALESNPSCVAARVALARTRMLERRYEDAAESARKALEVNPRSVPALSVLAAALRRSGRTEESAAALRQIETFARGSAVPDHELGVWLSAARQYSEAEEHFRRAIERDPTWSEPRTQLGLMYMQSGDERWARIALEASWNLDSFNQETHDVLLLLDDLDRFARHETDHFVLRFDPQRDAVIAPYLADHLEKLHPEITGRFRADPPRKTIVEVFPQHARFSVRISGRPWIHTVGACTGPVIALDAPRSGAAPSPFNWAQVLRHEYAHTVTLAATENRIPHWLTEGLAVWCETAPRPWNWCLLLADAVRRDRLFTLRTIDWGFMRPRRPDDRTLAYAQSEWMVEFIVERWGDDAVHALLAAFRQRKTQDEAFRSALEVSPAEFGNRFRDWARKQAEAWRLPLDPLPDENTIRATLLLRPRDAALLSQRAEWRLLEGDPSDALKFAQSALEHDPDQRRALRVLTSILLARADSEQDETRRAALFHQAEKPIRRFAARAPDEPDAVAVLARLEQFRENWPEAAAAWVRYQSLRPDDPDSYRRLGGIHLVRNEDEKALTQLEECFRRDEQNVAVARRIAGIHAERRDAARAAEWLERALEVDPYDAKVHRTLGTLYEELGRLELAEREYRALATLRPDSAEPCSLLAGLYRRMNRPEDAAAQEKAAAERRNDREPAED